MAEHDTWRGGPDGARRLDVLQIARGQRFGARDARVRDPAHQTEGDIQVAQTRPQDTHYRDDQDQERKGHQDIDDAHKDGVQPAAQIAGGDADQTAEEERKQDRNEADLEVQARAEHDATPDVATEVVRPEQVPGAQRRLERFAPGH